MMLVRFFLSILLLLNTLCFASPFEHMDDKELITNIYKITDHYAYRPFWENPPPPTCDTERDWKDACEMSQLLIKRNAPKAKQGFDCRIDALFYVVERIAKGLDVGMMTEEGSDGTPMPKEAFFFNYKRIAWVDPVEAMRLSRFLREGFKDLVPINKKWAEYWGNRCYELTKKSAYEWYVPCPLFELDIKE